ncbi:MAG TPA: malto-oligosyltrehalose trehalohydrolase [Gemmatimonadaceae bacterium]|nr:malto-oligosyltrehalose trehalohydrolase [Gemmatimonadaceae bacterium]
MTDASAAPRWSLERGARLVDATAVRFSVWAPRARTVHVRLCDGPARGDHPLAAADDRGGREVVVPNAGADADYMILIDGRPLPDPASRWQPNGVHAESRIVDPRRFRWTDSGWRGLRMDELAIYELHVGTFTPDGTFAAIVPRLADLKALGVTAIEIMPIAQFPGDRNWGYDGVGLYAVQNSYGGPYEFQKLVDAAHAVGLGVILDVVYNHVGPEGNYLDAFGPYFTDKYRTPWGRALNYDDAHSDEVRRFVIDNARHWVSEYRVDGLRLDAVHGIYDFSAQHLLREIAEAVHEQGALLGKSVVVIGESDLNDPHLVRRLEEHGFGLDGQWSDDFHHAVHAALTGERAGYYIDFGSVSHVADALREPFVFDGKYSAYRRRRHGAASVGIPRQRFVVAVQNHDQVGNRARGDRLSTLLDQAQLRLAAALLILSPYVPLIFMGEEYGETNPFLYFVSHGDSELVDAVRRGRRDEFAAFDWGANVPDPADPSTFEGSKIDWATGTHGEHARLLALYRDLLAVRREDALFRPDGARIAVEHDEAAGWITLLREPRDPAIRTLPGETAAAAAVFNCSARQQEVPLPESTARAWTLRLSTDASGYGGSDAVPGAVQIEREPGEPKRLMSIRRHAVRLPPWSAALYVAAAGDSQ